MSILAQPNTAMPPDASPAKAPAPTPTGGRVKKCAACGAEFSCMASCADTGAEVGGASACWCAAIPVSADVLARLRAQYQDCLCEPCLRKAGI